MEKRPRSFYVLAAFFGLFVLFLYGPTITIGILSFQGEGGGLTFPMRGVSLHWFRDLFEQQAVGVASPAQLDHGVLAADRIRRFARRAPLENAS